MRTPPLTLPPPPSPITPADTHLAPSKRFPLFPVAATTLTLAAGTSLALGWTVLAVGAVGAVVVAILLLLRSETATMLVVVGAAVGSAISPQYWLSEGMLEAQKAVLLGLAVIALARSGWARERMRPAALLVVAALATIMLSPYLPFADPVATLSALVTLGIGWLLVCVKGSPATARAALRAIQLAPLLNLAVGLVLTQIGGWSLFRTEFYSGVTRLQGSTIPPHLALLGLGAIVATYVRWRNGPLTIVDWGLALAALAVCLASATRGTSAVAVLLLLPLVRSALRQVRLRAWTLHVPAQLLIIAIAVCAAAAVGADFYARTTQGPSTQGINVLNTSGRLESWSYYQQEIADQPLGHGLGSIVAVSDAGALHAFNVPHNEYLRFAVELGVLGAVAFFLVAGRTLWYALAGQWQDVYLLAALALMVTGTNALSTIQFSVPLGIAIQSGAALRRDRR